MKDYILKCNGEDARDIMLIRLHMWEIQMNYKKETESILNPLCERMEDTTEHVIECGQENGNMYDIKDEHTKEEWLDVTKTYWENKRKREIKPERLQENEKRTEIGVLVEQQRKMKRDNNKRKKREK